MIRIFVNPAATDRRPGARIASAERGRCGVFRPRRFTAWRQIPDRRLPSRIVLAQTAAGRSGASADCRQCRAGRRSCGDDDAIGQRLARGWPGPLSLIIPASPLLCGDVHLLTGESPCGFRAIRSRAHWLPWPVMPSRPRALIFPVNRRRLRRKKWPSCSATPSMCSSMPGARRVASLDHRGRHGRDSGARARRRDRVGPRARIFPAIMHLPCSTA